MKTDKNILKETEAYIEKYNIDSTPEQLFAEFGSIVEIHKEFEDYLKTSKLIFKLNEMQRNVRLMEKRRLFLLWYITKNQKEQYKKLKIELSEMTFVSTKTIQGEVLKETTG